MINETMSRESIVLRLAAIEQLGCATEGYATRVQMTSTFSACLNKLFHKAQLPRGNPWRNRRPKLSELKRSPLTKKTGSSRLAYRR